jgi:hypothetical protein
MGYEIERVPIGWTDAHNAARYRANPAATLRELMPYSTASMIIEVAAAAITVAINAVSRRVSVPQPVVIAVVRLH